MKINIYLEEKPSVDEASTVLDLEPAEEHLAPKKVRQTVETTGHLVLEGATWSLLDSPMFWSVALASKAETLDIVLSHDESSSYLEEKLKKARNGLTTVQGQELTFIG